MREQLRKSGIDIIEDMPLGTYICQLYHTKEDLIDILIPYFKAGLENNEFCMWVTSQPLEVTGAKEALREYIPDLDVYLEKGQIKIIPYTEWYFKNGTFDSETALNRWIKILNQALPGGYNGLRSSENISRIGITDWSSFVDYEREVNNILGKYQTMALYTYSLEGFNAAEIIDVVINHQFSLIKREGKWERIEKSGLKDVAENKQIVKIQQQSDQFSSLKLENGLLSSRKRTDLELSEIIDVQAIQPLMDNFYKLTHIPIGLNDLKGNVLVGVGWQDICTRFHKVHPETCKHCGESNIRLFLDVAPGEFKLYKCKSNMWEVATPIVVEGQQVGYVFAGQFFFENEPLDYELFRSQARKYDFDEEGYIAALEKVPRLSREAVDTGMAFLMTFASMISQLSYSNIKLVQSLEERGSLVDALRESEERFRAVLENSLDVAYRRNLQTDCYDYMSPVVEQVTGFSAREMSSMRIDEILGRIHADDRPLIATELIRALDADSGNLEYRFKCKDGQYRWFADRFRVIKDQNGKLLFSGGVVRDITDTKVAEVKLKETLDNLESSVRERTAQLQKAYNSLKDSEKSLAEAQRMSHIGNWDWNIVAGKIYWSDELYRIFGLNPQKSGVRYNEFLNYVHPDDLDHVNNAVNKGMDEKFCSIDFRIISAGGAERIVHALNEVIFNGENIPVRVRGIVQDITERKIAEQKLQQSEAKYRSFIENFKGIAFEADENFFPLFLHGTVEEIMGYSEEEFISKRPWKEIIHPDDFPHMYEESKKVKYSQNPCSGEIDFRIIHRNGKIKWVHEIYQKIPGKNGIPDRYQGAIYDITERKEAEEALANLETARQKEIHHRIKNNLQVISSLLDLEAEKFKNKRDIENSEVLEAFMESQDRVVSIALIHEELHKGDETCTLNFSQYLGRLVENLFHTYRFGNTNISLNMDLEEDIFFDMDIAVPLGIIVNELVSNSFKHAFPGIEEGIINIKLLKDEKREHMNEELKSETNILESNNFILTVSDNGVGIPENFDPENSDTLGIQLITTLVGQLDGDFELKRDSGTEFVIRFRGREKQ